MSPLADLFEEAACRYANRPCLDFLGRRCRAPQLRLGASLTAEQLKDFLRDKISRIEMPKLIEFRAELPKTAIGKLSTKKLIAESLQKPKT